MISLIVPTDHTGYSRDDGEDAAEDDRDDGEDDASARFCVRHHFCPFTVLLMEGFEESQLYYTTIVEKKQGQNHLHLSWKLNERRSSRIRLPRGPKPKGRKLPPERRPEVLQ